jgi:hypothetical protein
MEANEKILPSDERFLLDVHDASALLDISEEELWGLVKEHKVPTHHSDHGEGGSIQFKKRDIEALKNRWRIERELFPVWEKYFSHHNTVSRASIADRFADFWYFNDFYVICSVLVVVLLYFIIASQ